uniref:Ion_trans domain-containing protein n=2 Tax=Strongyloides papillosus TaxID=174720 RepID=A0A0N5C306_STREA
MDTLYELKEQQLPNKIFDETSYLSSISTSQVSQNIENNISKKFLNSRTRIKKLKERIIYIFDYREDIRNPECKSEVLNRHILKKLQEEKKWDLLKHPYILNFLNENIIYIPEVYFLHIITYIFFLMLLYAYIFMDSNIFQNLLLKSFVLFLFEYMIFRFFLSFYKQKDLTDRFSLSHYSSILVHTMIVLLIWNIIMPTINDYIEGTKIVLKCSFFIILILSIFINCLYLISKSFYGRYMKLIKRVVMPLFGKSLLFIPTVVAALIAIIIKNIINIETLNSNEILKKVLWSIFIYLILMEIFLIIQSLNAFFAFDLRNFCKLRNNFGSLLLNEKINHSLECLEMIEACKILNPIGWMFTSTQTNNVLVINVKEISSYSLFESPVKINLYRKNNKIGKQGSNSNIDNKCTDISESQIDYRKKLCSSKENLLLKSLTLTSEILEYKGKITNEMMYNDEHWLKKFQRLLPDNKKNKTNYKQLNNNMSS